MLLKETHNSIFKFRIFLNFNKNYPSFYKSLKNETKYIAHIRFEAKID